MYKFDKNGRRKHNSFLGAFNLGSLFVNPFLRKKEVINVQEQKTSRLIKKQFKC